MIVAELIVLIAILMLILESWLNDEFSVMIPIILAFFRSFIGQECDRICLTLHSCGLKISSKVQAWVLVQDAVSLICSLIISGPFMLMGTCMLELSLTACFIGLLFSFESLFLALFTLVSAFTTLIVKSLESLFLQFALIILSFLNALPLSLLMLSLLSCMDQLFLISSLLVVLLLLSFVLFARFGASRLNFRHPSLRHNIWQKFLFRTS